MSLITIDPDRCHRDGRCLEACPVGLLEMSEERLPTAVADATERCIRCGHCVAVCPTGALENALLPRETFLPVPKDRPSADQTEALLLSRRSIRGFRNAPVPREQLDRLLEVARRAPTASNSQKLSWTVVQDPERLARVRTLSVEALRADPKRSGHIRRAAEGHDVILRGAPVLVAAFAPADYAWGDTDCAIALTYMELQAAAMGLGACWGGLVTWAARNVPALAEILAQPDGQRIGGALMLGLPRLKHFLVPPRDPARVTWR